MIFTVALTIFNLFLYMIIMLLPGWHLPDLLTASLASVKVLVVASNAIFPTHELIFIVSFHLLMRGAVWGFTLLLGRNRMPDFNI